MLIIQWRIQKFGNCSWGAPLDDFCKTTVLKNNEILQSSVGRSQQNPVGGSTPVHNNQNNACKPPQLSATRAKVRHSSHINKCPLIQKQSTKHPDLYNCYRWQHQQIHWNHTRKWQIKNITTSTNKYYVTTVCELSDNGTISQLLTFTRFNLISTTTWPLVATSIYQMKAFHS